MQRAQSGTIGEWLDVGQRKEQEQFKLLERDEPAKSRDITEGYMLDVAMATVTFNTRRLMSWASGERSSSRWRPIKLSSVRRVQRVSARCLSPRTSPKHELAQIGAATRAGPNQRGPGPARQRQVQHRQRPRFEARLRGSIFRFSFGVDMIRAPELSQADHGRENRIELVLLNRAVRTDLWNEESSAVLLNEADDLVC